MIIHVITPTHKNLSQAIQIELQILNKRFEIHSNKLKNTNNTTITRILQGRTITQIVSSL